MGKSVKIGGVWCKWTGHSVNAKGVRYKGRELSDVYGRYSSAKAAAMVGCHEMRDSLDGWGDGILSATANFFTYGFFFKHPDTGEVLFMKVTYANNYVSPVVYR